MDFYNKINAKYEEHEKAVEIEKELQERHDKVNSEENGTLLYERKGDASFLALLEPESE